MSTLTCFQQNILIHFHYAHDTDDVESICVQFRDIYCITEHLMSRQLQLIAQNAIQVISKEGNIAYD